MRDSQAVHAAHCTTLGGAMHLPGITDFFSYCDRFLVVAGAGLGKRGAGEISHEVTKSAEAGVF